jgi:transposase
VRGFAEGLLRDIDAVRAALSLPWSNGPAEGQINLPEPGLQVLPFPRGRH